MRARVITVCVLALACVTLREARAADVEMKLSATETYVGLPITVQITIRDAAQCERPKFPDIPGAAVRDVGGENRMTQMSVVNGRMSQSVTVSYQFQVTPQTAGPLTIPSIDVVADGKTHRTQPRTVVVSKSESGDLLFVDLVGSRPAVYVGEQLEVTLQIWIKPYFDRGFQLKLRDADMWGLVDLNNSQWGIFRESIEQAASRGRRPSGRETMRNDSQGQPHAYYLYQLQATMSPERPGRLDASNINVIVSYPTRLRRDESFFGGGNLTIDESRPVAAGIQGTAITVKPLPTEGRPPWFRDAVGAYDLTVSARPSDVAVGDPITLTLSLHGRGRLGTLQPPPLADMPELTRDFKVPSDPLAGTVEGDRKRFTQTIRARSDTIREIPAIPFAYFDPATEKYVTVHSKPIPLKVKPASQLAVSQVVQAQPNREAPTQLTERSGGILPNYTDLDDVLAQQAFTPGWPAALAGALPPFAFAACWLIQRRSRRLRTDVGYARRRSAARHARAALDEAARSDRAETARLAAAAVRGYVSDRCNLPAGSLTAEETVAHLSRRGAAAEAVRRVREFLDQCETAQYAAVESNGLCEAARRCIAQLERERF